VTAEKLYEHQSEKEPIVVDAIYENAHFTKQIEGHPFSLKGNLLDFYDSMAMLPRVYAGLT